MGYFSYNFIRHKIFILATYYMRLLHCMINGKTLAEVEPWLSWGCHNKMMNLLCLLSLLCWSKLHNS